MPDSPRIGTLNEKPLHAALKQWYAAPGDRLEVPVGGYVIDIVHGELLVEIQTGGFSSLKPKLRALLPEHAVRIVHPIPREKWIVKLGEGGERLSRRKSPQRGTFAHLFAELVSFPALMHTPTLSIDVLLIQEEELRRHEPGRAWRRKGWVIDRRRLIDVVDRRLFTTPADLAALIPPELPQPFTTAALAGALGIRRRLAQQMAYCLREMGVIAVVGKQGRALLYERGERPETSG